MRKLIKLLLLNVSIVSACNAGDEYSYSTSYNNNENIRASLLNLINESRENTRDQFLNIRTSLLNPVNESRENSRNQYFRDLSATSFRTEHIISSLRNDRSSILDNINSSLISPSLNFNFESLQQLNFTQTYDFVPLITAAEGPPPWPPLDHQIRNYLSMEIRFFLEELYRPRYNRYFYDFYMEDYFSNRFYNRYVYRNLIGALGINLNNPTLSDLTTNSDVTSQEALARQRETVRDSYIRMATEEPSAGPITKLLPAPDVTDTAFNECFADLDGFFDALLDQEISEPIKFRFQNAKRTLNLINGDESIEHHTISSVNQYSTYSYTSWDMPNTRQLLVLAWRLATVDTKGFVETAIAVHCDTPEKWKEWRKPFMSNSAFQAILSQDDFGLVLGADHEKGRPFINSIAQFLEDGETLPVKGRAAVKTLKLLRQGYIMKRAEEIMPVTEALFMVMRGHNNSLLDSAEQNRPACAEGAYLGMLKAISEMSPGNRLFSLISLEACN